MNDQFNPYGDFNPFDGWMPHGWREAMRRNAERRETAADLTTRRMLGRLDASRPAAHQAACEAAQMRLAGLWADEALVFDGQVLPERMLARLWRHIAAEHEEPA